MPVSGRPHAGPTRAPCRAADWPLRPVRPAAPDQLMSDRQRPAPSATAQPVVGTITGGGTLRSSVGGPSLLHIQVTAFALVYLVPHKPLPTWTPAHSSPVPQPSTPTLITPTFIRTSTVPVAQHFLSTPFPLLGSYCFFSPPRIMSLLFSPVASGSLGACDASFFAYVQTVNKSGIMPGSARWYLCCT